MRWGWILASCTVVGCSSSSAPAGGSSDAGVDVGTQSDAPRVPTHHRPTAITCDDSPPPEDCAGGCPGGCTAGTNGRCVHDSHICICVYDQCFTKSDCPADKSCACRTQAYGGHGSNVCIPSNCDVDADCGPPGYCSSTFDVTCGQPDSGIYCRTPKDTCVDDADCTKSAGGYCAYVPTTGHWSCNYATCAP